MNIKTTLKTSVAAAALFAVTAPMSTPANADIASGNKNKLTISGMVVKSLWYADDGVASHLFVTDGSTSRSRVRWVASGTLNENVTAGATIEMDIPLSNPQSSASLGTNGNSDFNSDLSSWAIRHQYVWVNHKKFGKLTLGNTDPSGNGNAEALLSGTTAIDLSSAKSFCAGCTFVKTTGGVTSRDASFTVAAHTNFDGLSRTDVVRYDTPNFMGVTLSGSLVGSGTTEWGAKYAGKFGPVAVDVRGVYDSMAGGSAVFSNQIAGSIAVLHDSGLNASFATGKASRKSNAPSNQTSAAFTRPIHAAGILESPSFWYATVGYKAKIFKTGGTNFNFHYQNTHDGNVGTTAAKTLVDSDNTTWGITALQEFDAIGANIGIFYKNYSLDGKLGSTGAAQTFKDIDVFGMQTVFNF